MPQYEIDSVTFELSECMYVENLMYIFIGFFFNSRETTELPFFKHLNTSRNLENFPTRRTGSNHLLKSNKNIPYIQFRYEIFAYYNAFKTV